jgi:2-polyprenyl-6-methoxyphenol hydroxylase-like FAD-dependent oxidoreductase
MKRTALISGASMAGLTLAYWLNKYGYQVTVVEISRGLRRGGSPIDVRGEALDVVKEMGLLDKIKAKEFVHTDEIVNAANETLVVFSINAQAEYLGDIEIHRDDLVDILYENISTDEVEFLFENRIEKLIQHEDKVEVTFKNGGSRNFDLVFGADGTHSAVRKLVFGEEENYSRFFGAYFAFTEAKNIQTDRPGNTGVIYNELGKMAMIYPFKKAVHAGLVFRSPKLNWDYKDPEQQKQILKAHFQSSHWKIPAILDELLHSDNLYFDEVCQIHMPAWTKGRVALVGDAAHTTSFPTGMGTSLAIQGAALLAKELHANDDHHAAFSTYYDSYKPFVESVQARIDRGLSRLLPETEAGLQEAIERFKK